MHGLLYLAIVISCVLTILLTLSSQSVTCFSVVEFLEFSTFLIRVTSLAFSAMRFSYFVSIILNLLSKLDAFELVDVPNDGTISSGKFVHS